MAQKYTEDNLRSEGSSDENSESEDLEISEMIRLKPFDMEPIRKLESWELHSSDEESEDSSDSEPENRRIGNNDWCVCGKKCKAMETYTESLYCQETNEIPEQNFVIKIRYF